MAVYIDDMYTIALGEFQGMKMSHLMADSTQELLSFVDRISVQRKWIQNMGHKLEHFDICLAKRKLAVKMGAKEVGMRILASAAMKRLTCNSKLEI